ncbi:MAG: helix-turn-helix domain-containing protein [Alphaproteobacteria bacterium]|nr:helix-turn-helix domain-containing protein [Alphaproteobacteria bacterium]
MATPAQRAYSRTTIEAGRLLGQMICLARKEQRTPAQELADRIGISRATLQRIEKGDLKTALGLYFEAATLLGVTLFTLDEAGLASARRTLQDKLVLLPQPPRRPSAEVDDEF